MTRTHSLFTGESRHMGCPMSEVLLSEHGNWRRLHWGALYSAYGRTPYFDYVADDIHRVIHGQQAHLLDYNQQLCQVVIEFMDLPVRLVYQPVSSVPDEALDLRRTIGTKQPDHLPITTVPYYQQWSDKNGFIPDLSILDLMMNMGREGIYTLVEMVKYS